MMNWENFKKEYNIILEKYFPPNKWIQISLDFLSYGFLPINGVYVIFSKKGILYIGNSGDIFARLKSHIRINKTFQDYDKKISKIKIKRIKSYYHSAYLEGLLILKLKPKYNKRIYSKHILKMDFEYGLGNTDFIDGQIAKHSKDIKTIKGWLGIP